MEKQRSVFSFLGNEQRVWEAIRFGAFAQLALEVLTKKLFMDLDQVKDSFVQARDWAAAFFTSPA